MVLVVEARIIGPAGLCGTWEGGPCSLGFRASGSDALPRKFWHAVGVFPYQKQSFEATWKYRFKGL